jgi:hypothetical protein
MRPIGTRISKGVVVAHPGRALVLVVAIAACSTSAAATDGTSALKASPSGAPRRIQVLRIVEAKHAVQAKTKVLSKSKKLAYRKVTRHGPALSHPLAPTFAGGTKSTSSPPFAVEQTGQASVGPPTVSYAVGNETTAPTRNTAEERAPVAHPIQALLIKTQNAGMQEQAKVLPGATPIQSSGFRKTDGQVAARWPQASELFTPLVTTNEHAPVQAPSGDANETR